MERELLMKGKPEGIPDISSRALTRVGKTIGGISGSISWDAFIGAYRVGQANFDDLFNRFTNTMRDARQSLNDGLNAFENGVKECVFFPIFRKGSVV